MVCLFGGLPDRLCRALENRRFPEGCRIHGGKHRRYAGVVISVAAEGKGISPAEALVSLSPCVTQADCFPSHTRNCGNRLRRPLCRISPILPFSKRQATEQRLSVWNITASPVRKGVVPGWRRAFSHRPLRPRCGERLQSRYDHAKKPCHERRCLLHL